MAIRHLTTVMAAILVLGLAETAGAQQSATAPAEAAGAQAVAPPAPSVDVNRLPVSLQRIQRELQATREREYRNGLNLEYFIEVFGQAPPLQILRPEDNLLYGPVPYGAPTHREMLYMMTPQEFRAPMMDFSGIFRWLADKAK